MKQPLTNKQKSILVWIAKHINTHGYQPSIRDIGSKFRISSPNGVVCHLNALERKGYIDFNRKTARAIKVFDWKQWAGGSNERA